MGKKFTSVACYVRVSTENQLENYSIEEQVERLKAYCKAKDFTVYDFYIDGGYSGGNINRPDLQRLMRDIDNKKIDLVLVYKLDRLSRSQKDTLFLIEDEFLAKKVEFVSVNENFDTSTPFGRAMIGILSVFAQLEKDQITERFTMGRIGRCKAGYYHGGPTPPTGYDYVDGELVVNEYEALQIEEIFSLFLKGHSINAIWRHMQKKYGSFGSSNRILIILRNSVYIGKVKFKGYECDGVHKPIIKKEDYEQVQKLLTSPQRELNKTSAQKTPFRAEYLLSSLIYCKRCGARYSANHGYYKCYSRAKSSKRFIVDPNCKNDNWKIDELDNIVINQIKELCYNQKKIDAIFSNTKTDPKVDTQVIEKRLNEIDEQLKRLVDLYQFGNMPMQDIKQRIDKLQSEREKLCDILENNNNDTITKQSFIENLKNFNNVFSDNNNLESKRLWLRSLINKIIIDGNNIDIEWRV